MWKRSADWLRNRGSDQWQYPVKMYNIEAAVEAGNCWLAQRDDSIIGTITVDADADPQLWPPEDQPDDALYVHRMVIEESGRGEELGSAMLDWVGGRATDCGRHWIRLDAWRSNTALHRYYLARGFELVRIVADPSGSGACFQRPANVRLGRGPCITTIP
ncbi:GNAT family N-acetyltransferase [Actinophytocola sp.]|uniref:GNAT family N-acetyltransferase n=1 Tax=Actinophytocola sp. TaxID=1872138 RepID=UPI00389ACEE9